MPSILLIFTTTSLSIFANYCFKRSAISESLKQFSIWQIPGHASGFFGVLAFTALLRLLPVSMAYPITQGCVVLGVQWIAARLFLKESISTVQWIGTAVLMAGILLIGR